MVGTSHGTDLETGATCSLWRSLGRILFGGETFFQNACSAPSGGGTVWVTSALPGDLLALDMRQESMLVRSRSTDQFLAWLNPQLPFERRGEGDWVARHTGLPKAGEP